MRHLLGVAAALLLVVGEMAGSPASSETATPLEVASGIGTGATASLSQAADRPAPTDGGITPTTPAASADAELPEQVRVVRPSLRIDALSAQANPRSLVRQARERSDVTDAVMVYTFNLSTPTSEGLTQLNAVAFDDWRFRRFTPEVTANTLGVWERLNEDNIVLTSAAAHRTDAALGDDLLIAGSAMSGRLRVGAVAENGVPQIGDVLVPLAEAERVSAEMTATLLVATTEDADPAVVADGLTSTMGGRSTVLHEPATQQVQANPVGTSTLESFWYQSVGDGTIRMDPAWVSRNITSAHVPILGHVRCHRVMIPQLRGALEEIEREGLGHLIHTYDGCWTPRHILWNPNRAISWHAWGLAIDIDAATNGYGQTPTMDLRIVDIFEKWGFGWGGDWSTPDGMHFELERVITGG